MDPSISGEPVVGVVIFLRGPLARLPEAAATATQPVVSLGWPNPRRLGPRGARAHRSDAAGRQGEHEDGPGAWPLDQRVGHQIRRRLTPERTPVTMPPAPAPTAATPPDARASTKTVLALGLWTRGSVIKSDAD